MTDGDTPASELIENYVAKEHKVYGTTVKVFEFETTPEQEAEMINRADEQGGGGAFDCARLCGDAMSEVGDFPKTDKVLRPQTLMNKVKGGAISEQTYRPPPPEEENR